MVKFEPPEFYAWAECRLGTTSVTAFPPAGEQDQVEWGRAGFLLAKQDGGVQQLDHLCDARLADEGPKPPWTTWANHSGTPLELFSRVNPESEKPRRPEPEVGHAFWRQSEILPTAKIFPIPGLWNMVRWGA